MNLIVPVLNVEGFLFFFLIPQPRIKLVLPAGAAWNFNHCTTREVPEVF